MSSKKIDEMETAEFDAMVDAFIERETQDTGELPAPIFYEALEAVFSEPTPPVTVELEAQIIGSELQFVSPKKSVSGIEIYDNEIVINNVRFVVHLASPAAA